MCPSGSLVYLKSTSTNRLTVMLAPRQIDFTPPAGKLEPCSGAGKRKKQSFVARLSKHQRRAAGEVSSDYRAAPSSAACATAREGSTPRMLATRSDSLNGTVHALRCCLNLNASAAT